MKDNILKIKLFDGSEYQIEITGDLFKKLDLKTKEDSLDYYTLDKILGELNRKSGNKIRNSKISEIEIPSCIKELSSSLIDRYSGLEGMKINGNPRFWLNLFGHYALSLKCVLCKSEDMKKYIEEHCAPDVKIFTDRKLYDQAMQKVKEQKTQECKALITCKTENGNQVYEFSREFEDSETVGYGTYFNKRANVLTGDFFNKFCEDTGVKLENIIGVKIFEGPRAIKGGTFSELPNLKDLELPNGIYYLKNGSLFTENRLNSLILPCSLVNLYVNTGYLYNGQEKMICDPFMVTEKNGGPRFLLLKDYKDGYKSNSDNINDFLDLMRKKYSGTQIFSDEEKFSSAMDKSVIKIVASNGKIYEREIEFADHEEFEQKSGKKQKYYKEDKRLTSDLLEKILKSCGLEKKDIKEVELQNVKAVGKGAFIECSDLEHVKLPYGIKELSVCAFHFCEKLKGINFPDSLEYIGNNSLGYCGLRSIVINKNLNFDISAFSYNKKLQDITIIENPEAEKNIKGLIEFNVIPKDVKIFHSLKERDDFYRNSKNENPEVYIPKVHINHNSDESISSLEMEASDFDDHDFKPKQNKNNQETKNQKLGYSALFSWKLLIPFWFFYKLLCIYIAKQNETLSNIKPKSKPRMQKNSHKGRFIDF